MIPLRLCAKKSTESAFQSPSLSWTKKTAKQSPSRRWTSWDLIERLSAKHRNLFIVGDPERAEKALFLTESEGFNVSTKMSKYPSRFLAEIKRELVVTEGVAPVL